MAIHDLPDAVVEEFSASLIPEAFERRTVASQVLLEDAGRGRDAFDAWASLRLADALTATWPVGGRPRVVGMLSDGRLRWHFDDRGCGLLELVASIMTDEARHLDDPWLFGAVLDRPEGSWEVLYDGDGNEIDEVWREPRRSLWQAAWYAEARGRGAAARQAGLLHLEGDELVDHRPLEVRESWVTTQLHRVLHGHPARKRFPLRSRRR